MLAGWPWKAAGARVGVAFDELAIDHELTIYTVPACTMQLYQVGSTSPRLCSLIPTTRISYSGPSGRRPCASSAT